MFMEKKSLELHMLCLYGLEGGKFLPPPLVLSVSKKALGPEGLTILVYVFLFLFVFQSL